MRTSKKKAKTHKNYWSNGLSIDETRVSTIILLTILFSFTAIYVIMRDGDIPSNLLTILITLVTGITTVNVADRFINRPQVSIKDTSTDIIEPASQRAPEDNNYTDGPTI